MNENDRTTLEQAIYEEMELTPEMIRSMWQMSRRSVSATVSSS